MSKAQALHPCHIASAAATRRIAALSAQPTAFRRATESTKTYGIVDEIVSRALRTGARIVSVRRDDVPGGGALAAILRHAI